MEVHWWGWEQYDVLINFAYDDFEQTKILELSHNAWKKDNSKYIINFSSRANFNQTYLKDIFTQAKPKRH